MTVDYHILGCNVRELRIRRGYSQEQLAELCDISPSFLGHIERGTRKMSLETLLALSNALRVTPNHLLREELEWNNDTLPLMLSELTFDDDQQQQRFYHAVRALIRGRKEL